MAKVTNTRKFSYPGYNEILTGHADERVSSNDKKPNPNVNVLEWLHGQPGFKDRVAVFASWDVFPYIFNCERSHLPIWPAWETRFENERIKPPAAVTEFLRDTTSPWDDVIFDSFLFHAALDHIEKQKPRVFFLGFGETDEWAHTGRYDCYLQAAHNVDRFVRTLWNTVQSIPQYRDTTTIIVSADHGRGHGRMEWKDHGKDIKGAEGIWLAVLGPDTPALGERVNTEPITQSQIAATVAALLGEDLCVAFPQAGAPISELIGPSPR